MAQETSSKTKAVESAIAQIEKDHGKGAIMRLGSREVQEVGAISTTCISLDSALGVGGLPRGWKWTRSSGSNSRPMSGCGRRAASGESR